MPASAAARSNVHSLGARAQLVGAGGVLGEERACRRGPASNRKRCSASATGRSVPGRDGEVQVGLPGQRGRARIDDDQARAGFLRLPDVRHEVDAGGGRVDAPQHDQPRVRVVVVGDARHLAVEPQVGGAGRRRADRARQPRGAEARGTARRRSCPASAGRSIRRSRTAGSLRRRSASRISVIRRAIRSSASSQVTRANVPWPLAPCRTAG